jgi:uncharacterized membrane protein YadS
VLAATLSVGVLSSQIGAMIKLLRVLMLGPVVLTLVCIMARRKRNRNGQASSQIAGRGERLISTPVTTLVPWFMLGFMALALCRSSGRLPAAILGPIASATHLLTIVSMAALGLNVDQRTLAQCGNKIALTVSGSLAALFLMSLTIVHVLPAP